MLRSRRTLLLALILGLLAGAVPAVALAGGCASCQQYTDPFGSAPTTHHATTPAPQSTPAPTTPAAATPTATAAPTTAADPTATAATTSTGGQTLPYTGYDSGLAALLGAGLVLGGAGLRRRLRRRP